jgi:hypothetical protein
MALSRGRLVPAEILDEEVGEAEALELGAGFGGVQAGKTTEWASDPFGGRFFHILQKIFLGR